MGCLREAGKGHRRRGFELIDLLVAIAIIALLISILLPALARARELARRFACQDNLNWIAMACTWYEEEDPDRHEWPYPLGTDTATDRPLPYTGVFNFKNAPPQALWYLVRRDMVMPKQLCCPSSGDAWVALDSYKNLGVGQLPYANVSYAYQVSSGKFGIASAKVDGQMPLLADQGPFGAVLEGGKTPDPTLPNKEMGWPGLAGTSIIADPDNWRPLNSPNHGGFWDGEGQNMATTDAKVEWKPKPMAGVLDDNIYTAWRAGSGGQAREDRIRGQSPTQVKILLPQGNTDSVLYP